MYFTITDIYISVEATTIEQFLIVGEWRRYQCDVGPNYGPYL